MGFKFGSRMDPKAASAKGSDDSDAQEDTPLNRLRAGLGLQNAAAPVQPTVAKLTPQPDEPRSETKPVEVKPAAPKSLDVKPADPRKEAVAERAGPTIGVAP